MNLALYSGLGTVVSDSIVEYADTSVIFNSVQYFPTLYNGLVCQYTVPVLVIGNDLTVGFSDSTISTYILFQLVHAAFGSPSYYLNVSVTGVLRILMFFRLFWMDIMPISM